MTRAHLAAWWQALRGLGRVLRQRREIQEARRVGRPYLETVITHGPPQRNWSLRALARAG
jgi:hypothetical protein